MSKKRIVYSTDQGRICPDCNCAMNRCVCGSKSNKAVPGDDIVRLQRQVKGRAGKPVIVITGLALASGELKVLAKNLKRKCGVGGTLENSNILIQGDKRDLIKAELESLGYTVKLSGG